LSLFGLSAAQIVKQTRARKADVEQALATAGSVLAKGAATRYGVPHARPSGCRGRVRGRAGHRVQIVSLLARAEAPMNVGQIVAAVDVGQSTVSAHLKVLVAVRFVLAEDRGTARYYRINDACVACFPTAADVVMGRPVPSPPDASTCTPRRPT